MRDTSPFWTDMRLANLSIFVLFTQQEFEQLMKENDLLEQKLQNQEDDFRLQNEALMKELAQVLV